MTEQAGRTPQPVGAFGGRSLRPVSAGIVSRIRDQLDGETDEALMGRFGISYNTWRKVRSGEPIRRSVADRLEQRMAPGADLA